MTAAQELMLWLASGFAVFLFVPLVLCWALFGIAWLKGWRDPNITPAEILERLFE